MSEKADLKAWTAHALAAAACALDLPEDESQWSVAERAQYDELLVGALQAAARQDATRVHHVAEATLPVYDEPSRCEDR